MQLNFITHNDDPNSVIATGTNPNLNNKSPRYSSQALARMLARDLQSTQSTQICSSARIYVCMLHMPSRGVGKRFMRLSGSVRRDSPRQIRPIQLWGGSKHALHPNQLICHNVNAGHRVERSAGQEDPPCYNHESCIHEHKAHIHEHKPCSMLCLQPHH